MRLPYEEVSNLVRILFAAREEGLLEIVQKTGDFVWYAFRGTGKPISKKWNVQIYHESTDPAVARLGQAVVCVDELVLSKLMSLDWSSLEISDLPTIAIDDAGIGFPLGGVMVGASDGDRVVTDVVPVTFFQEKGPNPFWTHRYLHEFARRGVRLVEKLGGATGKCRIEICSGYINSALRDDLRQQGYEVRVVEVTGLLQRELENRFRSYVRGLLNADLYYDPKRMTNQQIAEAYSKAMKFGSGTYQHLLKTGWRSMGGSGGGGDR